MYEKGVDKYIKEFDAVYYAKSLRNLRMLVSSLMDHNERFMAAYQHCNSISLLKSDTESESENEAVQDMPDYLQKKEEYQKEHRSNIKAFLDMYLEEKHTSKDYKLLKGAFTSKRLQNDELKNLELETDIHSMMPSRFDSSKNNTKLNKLESFVGNGDQWANQDKLFHDSVEDISYN